MGSPYTFGWRPSLPDISDLDRLYTAPRHLMANLPSAVDNSVPALPAPFEPTDNQADLGSCGPSTAAEDILFAALRQQKKKACPMPSRNFIYWCTRYLMNTVNSDSGVDNRTLMQALAKYGWCDESLWPYYTDSRFKDKPSQACFDQAATRKITNYHSVPQDLDTIKACLAGGDTFILGFTVYQSMLTPEVDRTGKIPMPTRRDKVAGGHDVLAVGYNDTTRLIKVKNHWWLSDTVPWGVNGYGYIPYDYVTSSQLAGDFWTLTHPALPDDAPEPPPPPPPPVPTPGGKVTFSFWFDEFSKQAGPVVVS